MKMDFSWHFRRNQEAHRDKPCRPCRGESVSVTVSENVCPRFRPEELGLEMEPYDLPGLFFGDEELIK